MAYLGIVEGTRVKRAGFAYRATYEEVLARYRMLSKVGASRLTAAGCVCVVLNFVFLIILLLLLQKRTWC